MVGSAHRFGSAAGAVLLVVLGAALALGAEEWRDARDRAERVDALVAGVTDELRVNRERVERAGARHARTAEQLTAIAARGALPGRDVYLGGMFNPALVGSTAWQTARETGLLGELPLDLVLVLASVYEEQARYRALGDAMVIGIMTDVRRDGMEAALRDRFEQFIPLAVDFSNREKTLLERYDAALEQLAAYR